ncbi:MAG: MotA/TolQ/ExbB proton channel family protein [Methylacidiphilales bacterium]|nr:MotA/TolQ/ExbB proton channel family protein [Candidatus Methylacidiphilales bacterium]
MKRFLLTAAGLLLAATVPALAQTTGNDAVEQMGRNTTLLDMVAAAGWVMIPLAVASMVMVTLVIYCFFTLTEKSITTPELLERMEPFFENEDLDGLAAYVEARPQATARMVDRILQFMERHPDADADSIKTVAETEGSRIAAALNQRVLYIMDVGVLSPMLGLFGTVIGILNSFGHIAQEASPMRTMLLAGGVSQALIATAGGLTIGITAMAFFAYFRGRVAHLISILETEGTLLTQELILLSRRHRIAR